MVLLRVKLLTALLLFTCLWRPASVSAATELRVYYAGPTGGLGTSLELAASFPEVNLRLVDNPDQADVLVLNGLLEDPNGTAARLRSGVGLVLIMSPKITPEQLSLVLGSPVSLNLHEAPLSLIAAREGDDVLARQVVWNSAPQVRQRFEIIGNPLQQWVAGFENPEVLLSSGKIGQGQVFLLAPFLSGGANPQFQEWAYFNYVIYHLAARAAGETPSTFADYPGSPVPHTAERSVMFGLLGLILGTAAISYVLVRRYSRRHPELLGELVVDSQEFATRQVGTDWESIGFHRPLGGFMLAFMLGLVMFVPLIIYQNLILPVYLLPSAQALGIWGRVTQFFNLLWVLFDMGTSAAFIRFFAQYRISDKRKAMMYGQVFVWWQALSGAVQVALIIALSGTYLTRSVYAIYAWSIIIHTLIQIPGFYQVMRHVLMALQRFDYAQILDVALAVIFPMLTQPIFVTVMVVWGRNHPIFGSSMGGLLGLGLAGYAAEALTFIVGFWLYRRLGFNVRLLFLAHFDWQTVKESFRFGSFEMLGSVAWMIGQAAEVLITQARLVNYNEIWGNWTLAQNFIFAFQVTQTLFANIVPSISEAISHTRRLLSQYYAAVSYKWGGIISAYIAAILLAVADRFILGASGPEFVRAAAYAVPLIVWGAIQYPSWVGDNVQLGANHPYLKAALVTGEQAGRITLALLLLERLQINALIVAYFVSLLAKDIAAYFINHRICFPQRFYVWQSLIAPLLSGAAHYAVLRWLTGLIWRGDQMTSVLIFLVGILPSFPLFALFYGLFGGWDNGTLDELRRAVDLSGFMRPLAWLFWAASTWGARLSPLHGRFPILIRAAALAEAESLAREKIDLVG